MKKTLIPAALLALSAVLVGCSSEEKSPALQAEEKNQSPFPAVSIRPGKQKAATEFAIGTAWNESTESEKNEICTVRKTMGEKWMAQKLKDKNKDKPDQEQLDWTYAAKLYGKACDKRDFHG